MSQLSIEISSRTYGSGVLKIEPSAAKRLLVFLGNSHTYPKEIAKQAHQLIQDGKREQAMNIVDDWFVQALNISKGDIDNIIGYYRQLKKIRLGVDLAVENHIRV